MPSKMALRKKLVIRRSCYSFGIDIISGNWMRCESACAFKREGCESVCADKIPLYH
jgi:hypothetical protein